MAPINDSRHISEAKTQKTVPLEKQLRMIFDYKWYSRFYLGQELNFDQAFEHFVRKGSAEFLNPHPLFITRYYLGKLPKNEPLPQNPLVHYLTIGAAEGYSPFPLFDPEWYAARYDTASSGLTPFVHYVMVGAPKNYDPNEFFDASAYMSKFGIEARQDAGYAVLHYMRTAFSLRQDTSDKFSTADYLWFYPHLEGGGINPLQHYLEYGRKELLKPRRSVVDFSRLTPEFLEQVRNTRKGNIVVCTAIAGGYSRLLPHPYINPEYRYVCFTDEPVDSFGIWEVRPMPYWHRDATRRARFCKLHIPKLFIDAEWVIWIDANILINGSIEPYLNNMNSHHYPLGLLKHPLRNCVYKEAEACILAQKDSTDIINSQIAIYKKDNYPESAGLYETNVMIVNVNNLQIQKLFLDWWEHLSVYSRRDQLSLPYLMRKYGIKPYYFLGDGYCARNHKDFIYIVHKETNNLVYR